MNLIMSLYNSLKTFVTISSILLLISCSTGKVLQSNDKEDPLIIRDTIYIKDPSCKKEVKELKKIIGLMKIRYKIEKYD